MIFIWILALLGSIAAGLTLFGGILFSNGAPQQAAAAAIAVGFAVIPYCFARAIEKLNRGEK
jgi:hypothetical protein